MPPVFELQKILQIRAGPLARARILEAGGLRPEMIASVAAAAGGPKGLILNPLDRWIFGHWLPSAPPTAPAVQLLGASIGSWRMSTACRPDPDSAFQQLAQDYIDQHYPHEPGRPPRPQVVSQQFGQQLAQHLQGDASHILHHPRYRLHVVATRGRGILNAMGQESARPWAEAVRFGAGLAGAWALNALSRPWQGLVLERVLFSDPRSSWGQGLDDYPGCRVSLSADNLVHAVLASCSIPWWLLPQRDIAGAPAGAYWDGGLSDYHLHWPYQSMNPQGLTLFPHFQPELIPGWFDKPFPSRHRPGSGLDNVILLSPSPEWIARLPLGKLPDRSDFQRYGDDLQARRSAWTAALQASQVLAEAFQQWIDQPDLSQLLPLESRV